MPIYEYECKTCGEEFEEIQKFSDPPLKNHTCSPMSQVHRKISLNAFQLKGGGWYSEGYSGGKADNGKSANEGDGAAKSDNGSDGKSESVSASSASEGNAGSGNGSEKGSQKGSQKGSETKATGGDSKPAAASSTGAAKSAGSGGSPASS